MQSVGIASALLMEPQMVIADEPLSMLDVSIHAGILVMLKKLALELHSSCFYVSHDLSILGHIADRLMIMYLRQAVEVGLTRNVIQNPKNPYIRTLISAVPVPDPCSKRAVPNIIWDISRPIDPPPVCRFTLRCPYSDETFSQTFLKLDMNQGDKHLTACHRQDAFDS